MVIVISIFKAQRSIFPAWSSTSGWYNAYTTPALSGIIREFRSISKFWCLRHLKSVTEAACISVKDQNTVVQIFPYLKHNFISSENVRVTDKHFLKNISAFNLMCWNICLWKFRISGCVIIQVESWNIRLYPLFDTTWPSWIHGIFIYLIMFHIFMIVGLYNFLLIDLMFCPFICNVTVSTPLRTTTW